MESLPYQPDGSRFADAWEAEQAEVDRTVDRLGLPVDNGIRTTVIALRLAGYETTASCEGHTDHGCCGPWVDMQANDVPALRSNLDQLLDEFRQHEPTATLMLTSYPFGGGPPQRVRLWSAATNEGLERSEERLSTAQSEMEMFTRFLMGRLEVMYGTER